MKLYTSTYLPANSFLTCGSSLPPFPTRFSDDLLQACDYANQPANFARMINTLDVGIRLITPTDPTGTDSSVDATTSGSTKRYYQLSHDSLVSSLRDWLTHRQQLEPRGRAELLLEERAALWDEKPENPRLPSLLEVLKIRWYVSRGNWDQRHQLMMRTATK